MFRSRPEHGRNNPWTGFAGSGRCGLAMDFEDKDERDREIWRRHVDGHTYRDIAGRAESSLLVPEARRNGYRLAAPHRDHWWPAGCNGPIGITAHRHGDGKAVLGGVWLALHGRERVSASWLIPEAGRHLDENGVAAGKAAYHHAAVRVAADILTKAAASCLTLHRRWRWRWICVGHTASERQ